MTHEGKTGYTTDETNDRLTQKHLHKDEQSSRNEFLLELQDF